MYAQTEYLNQAKTLRDTAAERQNVAVRDALQSWADAYEGMASWLAESDQKNPPQPTGSVKVPVTSACAAALPVAGQVATPFRCQVHPRF